MKPGNRLCVWLLRICLLTILATPLSVFGQDPSSSGPPPDKTKTDQSSQQQPDQKQSNQQQPNQQQPNQQQPSQQQPSQQQPNQQQPNQQQPTQQQPNQQQPTQQQPDQQPPTNKQQTTQPQTAQQPAQPQTGQCGPCDQQTWGDYIVSSTVEFGARAVSVGGNVNQYKSDLNYSPSLRIFDSSFHLTPKDSNGGLIFDELLFNSSGWGGDPQGYTYVSVEKTGVYRFTGNIRSFKYFNDISNFALGQHTLDTQMHVGDYLLTILPENRKLKFYLGYSHDSIAGPGLTTYDFQKDEFPINTIQRSNTHDFTGGADARIGNFDLSFLQGFRDFKDDTTFSVTTPNPGNNLTNTSQINTLSRSIPTAGHHFYTRFSAHTVFAKRLDVTARYIYTGSTTNFSFFENVTGISGDSPPKIINPETATATGTVKRPYNIAELGMTYLATDKLRISDTFRFDQFSISGGNVLADLLQESTIAGVPLPPVTTLSILEQSTKYRRFLNTIEGDYQFNLKYSAHIGYRFTDRHVELSALDVPAQPETGIFSNNTNSVIFGAKAHPYQPWTLYFDGEHGSSDSVFLRLQNLRSTNFRVRNHVDLSCNLSFTASFVFSNYNSPTEVLLQDSELPPGTAPNALDVNIKNRVFTSTLDWTPNSKYTITAGYTHLHLTSDAGIILFLNKVSEFGQSDTFMRDNFVFFDVFAHPTSRISLFASYRINRDPGQGNLTSLDPAVIIGSYPFTYQSPEARLTVKLTNRLDWNVGYQYYNYRDWFTPTQNYHAHLPYMSLRVYIGGPREGTQAH